MENYWFNPQVIDEIKTLAPDFSEKKCVHLVFSGEKGISKHDAIQLYLETLGENKIVLNHLDFSFQEFSIESFLASSFQYFINQQSFFQNFLQRFSEKQQRYIQQKLEEVHNNFGKKEDWYLEIYLELLASISDKNSLVIILKNIDHISQADFESLQKFLLNFSNLPIQIIYSRDADDPFKHTISGAKEVVLSKLSIQSMEKAIQKSFRTSVLNARLITNHCYLKTGGIPLKVSLLLHSLYRSILEHQQPEIIHLKKLQKLKVPELWDEIFGLYYRMEDPIARKVLAITALIDEPFCSKDFVLTLSHIGLPKNSLDKWINLGILKYFWYEGEKCLVVEPLHFKKWIREFIPIEELSELLIRIAQLQLARKFKKVYPLSDIVHRAGENQLAMTLAEIEGHYFYQHKKFLPAVDRLYFFVRTAESDGRYISRLPEVFEKLADLYIQLGIYENAFEMLKKYRGTFSETVLEQDESAKTKWLEINLKMARVLIEMDSFHEARYLIRETQVKKYSQPHIIAQCYELSGDIEVNLAHPQRAIQYYKRAFIFYQKAKRSADLYPLYDKLKTLVKGNRPQQLKIIREFERVLDKNIQLNEFKAILFHDEISLLLQNRIFFNLLPKCHSLEKLLNDLYEPKLNLQLTFYLSEIYAQRGKWSLVLKYFNKAMKELYVEQHPELQVQILLQLALVYKEQAHYGTAVRMLNSAQEIAVEKNYLNQIHEMKLHLGHIYLLVHNFLKAFDLLKEVQQWANVHHQNHLGFLVRLYLSYYELSHKRMEKSRQMLSEAKRILNQNFSVIDYLNYLFYLAIWLIQANRPTVALWVINRLLKTSEGIPRYRISSFYLKGVAEFKRKEYISSKKYLQKALMLSAKWDFPWIKYLVLCAQARHSAQTEDQKIIQRQYHKACRYIKDLAENMGDNILGTQFLESQSHEDILFYCKK